MKNKSLITDPKLHSVHEKVISGESVTENELLQMLRTDDVIGLGSMANYIRKNLHQDKTYYSVNMNLNYTNICELRCPLCAFSRDCGDDDAYSYSIKDICSRVEKAVVNGVDEVHIVGGLRKELKLGYFTEMLREIKKIKEDIFIVAFTAVEIDYFAALNNLSHEQVLKELIDAGLGAMPGGGAEIFAPDKREIIAPKKVSGDRWLQVMETAHSLGLKTNVTMLYNHIEDDEDIVDHMKKIRDLQNSTGGFKTFVPLPYHDEKASVESKKKRNTGFDDLRIYSSARIYLHNIPHVKALWMYLSEKLAQVMLDFGVDDIGGTYNYEKVVHSAGANTPDSGTEERLRYLIQSSGRVPVRAAADYIPRNHETP